MYNAGADERRDPVNIYNRVGDSPFQIGILVGVLGFLWWNKTKTITRSHVTISRSDAAEHYFVIE